MSERNPTKGEGRWLFDGLGAADGGINTGASESVKSIGVPNGLDRNQLRFAVNATMRGGNVSHRSTYAQRILVFPDGATQSGFEGGLWQGASFYEATRSSLVASISGRLFQIQVERKFQVSEISVPNQASAANLNYAWFAQLGPFLVRQDGASTPIIFDGTSSRRAKPNEIKPGTVMAVALGRIWYATPDGLGFRATDIAGNTFIGSAMYRFMDSGLLETENTFLNEGRDFTVPPNSGGIRAMATPAMLDTSLGQGPLQVFTSHGAFSINAPIDRKIWKDVTYPIQTISQFEFGAVGSRSTLVINGDIFFRSPDGIRSYILARKDFHIWLNTPISLEVGEILEGDNDACLFWGSAVNFKNRMLMTCWPQPTRQGYVHHGIIPLDFNLVTSMRERAPAAWEGVLTGLSVLQLVKGTFGGVERAFAFVLSQTGKIELWEVVEDGIADEPAGTPPSRVSWSFETPSYDFSNPTTLKRLMSAAIWLEDVQETVDFKLQFKPDRYPCWIDWYQWQECAPVTQCLTGPPKECKTLHNFKPQYRTKIKIPQPPELCNPTVFSLYRDCFEMAFRLQVAGHATVKKMRFAAQDRPETTFDDCQPVGPCIPLDCCVTPDPLSYVVPNTEMVGIVEEDTSIWITREDNTVVREENQPQFGTPGVPPPPPPPVILTGACTIGGTCSILSAEACSLAGGTYAGDGTVCPVGPPMPVPNQPVWPIQDLLPGMGEFGPLQATDLNGVTLYIGVNPGSLDPGTYSDQLASGSVAAWAAELWQQFLDSATPFSSARIDWKYNPMSGANFVGWSVFPDQTGAYSKSIDLIYTLVVHYLP